MNIIDHLRNTEQNLELLKIQVKEHIEKIVYLQNQRRYCKHDYSSGNSCTKCGIDREYAEYQRIGVFDNV